MYICKKAYLLSYLTQKNYISETLQYEDNLFENWPCERATKKLSLSTETPASKN